MKSCERRLAIVVLLLLVGGCGSEGAQFDFEPAQPGGYVSEATGSFRGPRGAREIEAKSVLTVDQAKEDEQHSASRDEKGGRPTDTVRKFEDDGVYLVKIGNGLKGFVPDQPVLLVPANPTAGKTWSWEMASTDGVQSARSTFRLLSPSRSIAIGNESVRCIVIRWSMHLTGDVDIRVNRTIWFSPQHSLDVKVRTVSDSKIPVREHQDVTAVMQSLTPS